MNTESRPRKSGRSISALARDADVDRTTTQLELARSSRRPAKVFQPLPAVESWSSAIATRSGVPQVRRHILLLEPADAARFTDMVDHHADASTPLIAMSGVVRAIDAVSCHYEQPDGASVMTPAPRSGVLRSVSSVDGWEREDDGSTFVAYAVDVELESSELS